MNKKFFLIFFLFVLLMPVSNTQAATSKKEWLYVIKDDFISSDQVLVARTSSLYKNELWVVEYGVGCLSMWRYEDKYILATYSMWLDGIGGNIILPNKYAKGSCRIWDAKKIEDVIDNLRDEDIEWLRDNDFLN